MCSTSFCQRILFSSMVIAANVFGCSDNTSVPSSQDSRVKEDSRLGDLLRIDQVLKSDTSAGDTNRSDHQALKEIGVNDTRLTDGARPDSNHPLCSSAGGTCTQHRWEICPIGKEPIDPDPHRGCGTGGGADGWCCVDAPPSSCSSTSGVNCIVGTTCQGCWMPSEDLSLSCEAGRVCCFDGCD